MAGYRFMREERELIINLVKKYKGELETALEGYEKTGDEIGKYAAQQQLSIATTSLAKLEGTFGTDD